MKFALDFLIKVDEESIDSKTLLAKPDAYKASIAETAVLEGALVITLDGESHCEEYIDPILRLGDQWIRKLSWVLGGDTETVAYRNTEHCFAFVPEGDSVEVSFFLGSETEVEEYVIEPTNVRLETFASESIRLCERILELLGKVSPAMLESNDDAKDLKNSLEEAKRAWRDYQLHNRR